MFKKIFKTKNKPLIKEDNSAEEFLTKEEFLKFIQNLPPENIERSDLNAFKVKLKDDFNYTNNYLYINPSPHIKNFYLIRTDRSTNRNDVKTLLFDDNKKLRIFDLNNNEIVDIKNILEKKCPPRDDFLTKLPKAIFKF